MNKVNNTLNSKNKVAKLHESITNKNFYDMKNVKHVTK